MRKYHSVKDRLGNRNPNWKGDKVKLNGLHGWVRTRLPMPALCQGCNEVPPLDLANKGIYDRSLSNWEYLCRRCHMRKDGRAAKLGVSIRPAHNWSWPKGTPRSEETKRKMSLSMLAGKHHHAPDARRRISEAKAKWWKEVGTPSTYRHTEEHKKKLSEEKKRWWREVGYPKGLKRFAKRRT